MKTNKLKEKFRRGEAAIGTFVRLNSISVEVLGLTGWDFVIIDVEHGIHTMEDISNMVRAARSVGITSIVRVPGVAPINIQRTLDASAEGVQIPQLTSLTEVKDAVMAARYHPLGNRGSCPFNASTGYATVPFDQHIATSNQEVMVVVHVENVWAADNIEKILEVPGIDVAFCGPYDLSQSMGLPGQTSAQPVVDKILAVFEACRRKGVVNGVFVGQPEMARVWADRGAQYLAYSADVGLFTAAAAEKAAFMKEQLGQK